MSAVQLQRRLGLARYETYVGGRTRGKGRGVTDQVRVIGAVEVKQRKVERIESEDDYRHTKAKPWRGGRYAGRLRLAVIPDKTAKTCGDFIRANVDTLTEMVVTDGSISPPTSSYSASAPSRESPTLAAADEAPAPRQLLAVACKAVEFAPFPLQLAR